MPPPQPHERSPLVIIGTTPSQDTYAVAVRKTDTALLGTVNDGLVLLMNDPSWQQLKEKYQLAFFLSIGPAVCPVLIKGTAFDNH